MKRDVKPHSEDYFFLRLLLFYKHRLLLQISQASYGHMVALTHVCMCGTCVVATQTDPTMVTMIQIFSVSAIVTSALGSSLALTAYMQELINKAFDQSNLGGTYEWIAKLINN
jgi:hypothetical protein